MGPSKIEDKMYTDRKKYEGDLEMGCSGQPQGTVSV